MLLELMGKAVRRAQRREISRLVNDKDYAASEISQARHAEIGRLLDRKSVKRVLELGCGPGRYVAMLASAGFEVVGVDPYSFESWDLIKGKENVTLTSGIRAESIPFEDQSFDAICCLSALLYFDDPELALKEIRRVLKPGGFLVMRSVNSENKYTKRTKQPIDPSSKNLYSMDELTELISDSGFEIRKGFSYGYYPSRGKTLYWFAVNTLLNGPLLDFLSAATPRARRVNNIIHSVRGAN